ncbi:MAG: CYTH domain-containing protein [Patescibacteria group bacterium]|jgi:adenylate cyclase class IV|nr:CYTH domain-containing protein [Patescibacteria group bacterium]
MNIEVERKAFITKQQYNNLANKLLQLGAKDLGPNNTNTTFYITEKEQVKVQHQVSKGNAKMVWKSGGLVGKTSRQEIELVILPSEIAKANIFIERLLTNYKKYISNQLRHDYILNGLDIAIKYSDNWGYHLEIDKNVASDKHISKTLQCIEDLAKTLDIKLMSNQEEQKHLANVMAQT